MKLWAAAIVTGATLAMISSSPAIAHTVASDGRISALMHIDPNDQPKPNGLNTVHFYFNDQDGRFTMEGCDCKVKINEGKKLLLNSPLDAAAVKTGITKVFLPVNNFSYDVVVSGTPKSAGFFQPFKLTFDIDVGNPPPDKAQSEDGPNLLIHLVELSIVVAGVVGYIVWRKRIRMKR